MSSVNAFLPDPTIVDYCAAKAVLSNFCKALSKEVGPRGVRVNTVSPGPVSTALWLGDDGVAATVAKAAGGDPEDIAPPPSRSRRSASSASPRRSPTWSCCWPATGWVTSPAATSSSMAASYRDLIAAHRA
ncbi:SDR family NAD(P)-dependent oxidoreductase [Kitasatospora sp. NPDC058115]|uniref:SDR family NAD(P)-dependent oxidoreductase n=1 Tax=Kitasatospora sp. NPDC058115 TaxID=3346347 RepID=UPI0036DADE40